MGIKQRIKRLEWVEAGQLVSNPKNWRTHNDEQRQALRRLVEAVGFAGAQLVYELEDGRYMLIDGHLRADEFSGETLPVLVTDLDASEADAVLAFFDDISTQAGVDEWARESLLLEVGEAYPALFDVGEAPELVLTGDDEALFEWDEYGDGRDIQRDDIPDAIFPSDNEQGIPTLDISLQADYLDLPADIWGRTARQVSKRMGGTWMFYTDDFRFNGLWTNPADVLNTKAVNAVEPNFSVYRDMPYAVGLFQIYKKRWIARYWQSHGLKIFVDMNVNPVFYEANLLGVPAGWKAYATRGTDASLKSGATLREYELARERAGCDPLFVVYGGGKGVEALCRQHGFIHLKEVMDKGVK